MLQKIILTILAFGLLNAAPAFAKGGGSYWSALDAGNQTSGIEYAWGGRWKHQIALFSSTNTNTVQWNPHYLFNLAGTLYFGLGGGISASENKTTKATNTDVYGGLSLDWAFGALHLGYENHFINNAGNSSYLKLGWAF